MPETRAIATTRMIGLAVGLTLGIVWMWLGFGAAVLCAILAFLGWLIGGLVTAASAGTLNLSDVWNAMLGRQT